MNFVQALSISLIAGVFLLAFGIAYLKYKENLIRLQRNEDTKEKKPKALLTIGIILTGTSIGITLATIVNELFFERYGMLVYVVILTFSAGISMIIAQKFTNK